MSFYQTQNPTRFTPQNPNVVSVQHIQYLRSGFNQAYPVEVSGDDVIYSPESLILNRFITRVGLTGDSSDQFPTAAQIINALNKDQWIRQTSQDTNPITVQPGFYVDVSFYNESDYTFYIYANTGISIGFLSDLYVDSGKLVDARFHVTNVTAGSEEIYVSVLTNLPALVAPPPSIRRNVVPLASIQNEIDDDSEDIPSSSDQPEVDNSSEEVPEEVPSPSDQNDIDDVPEEVPSLLNQNDIDDVSEEVPEDVLPSSNKIEIEGDLLRESRSGQGDLLPFLDQSEIVDSLDDIVATKGQ